MSSISPIRVTGLSGNFDMEGIIEASMIRDKEKVDKAKQEQTRHQEMLRTEPDTSSRQQQENHRYNHYQHRFSHRRKISFYHLFKSL